MYKPNNKPKVHRTAARITAYGPIDVAGQAEKGENCCRQEKEESPSLLSRRFGSRSSKYNENRANQETVTSLHRTLPSR